MINFIKNIYKNDKYYFIIFFACLVVLASMIKINTFRYNNFDMGKFDLGNMSQMSWYSLRGKFMYLTDYFGSNVPRWSMSHVDPILALFLPLYYFFPEPLTLVFAQNALVIFSAFFIYEIAKLKTKNRLFSLLISLSYLSYPPLGFLVSWTGYHGVTPAIFFFFWFFYLFEKYRIEERRLTFKNYFYLTVIALITMFGKEQIALYFILTSVYIFFTSNYRKYAIFLFSISIIWFITAFFIIIPYYSSYRIASFENFLNEFQISKSEVPNIYSENYFLSRYSEFGQSYSEIIANMVLNPVKTSAIFISGDKLTNLNLTFGPVLYSPVLAPLVFFISFPDLLINYSTTQGGIGTSEIYNHRISMIIPVIFLSVVYGFAFISRFLKNFIFDKYIKTILVLFSLSILISNVYFSIYVGEKNPLYAWIIEAVNKRVLAKTEDKFFNKDLKIGESVRLSPMDQNERDCIRRIVDEIPPLVSVSGPDFMGSHLSKRETYAIFPAGSSKADYVIIDIFSKKLQRILELDYSLNKDFTSQALGSPEYSLDLICGNLMVLKRKSQFEPKQGIEKLPFQSYIKYNEKFDYEIYNSLTVVDYSYTKEITLGSKMDFSFVYKRKEQRKSLDGFNIFTTLVNSKTGDMYQIINYPSYVFSELNSYKSGMYYEEKFQMVVPYHLERGVYKVFVGIDNKINTRSVYIGDTEIK